MKGSSFGGGGSRRGRRQRFAPDATINLTSLLDIVFNLLLVFMIMAPALKHGIEVEMARTGAGSASVDIEEPLRITIGYVEGIDDPRVYLEERTVEIDELPGTLQQSAGPDTAVLIIPDRRVPTEVTLQVLGAVVAAGIETYGFETEPQADEGS